MTRYLSAQNVRKTYGTTVALQDASLDVYQSEILALLGPNGAGKTTLIKVLATLLTKDAGQVNILGYDLDKDPEAIRHVFGYVGQDTERSAYGRLTVTENLHFFGKLRGMATAQINQQIKKLATYFDFHENLEKQFVQLSGGQKQTVVIMRALLHDPPLVYLDEPTKGLDPIIARKIRRFLKQFVTGEQKSLLLTSHIMTEVEELADRVALIHQGTIPICGTPEELKAAVGTTDFVEIEKVALPDDLRQTILQLPSISGSFERNDEWFSFGVNDVMSGAEDIIRTLREAHVQAGFRHHTVSLEDAFIYHIGELSERFE
jgi:ABC-2 type transport system ATP-binding protein